MQITEEELDSIRNYTGLLHKEINSLLSSGLSSEYSYLTNKNLYLPTFENEQHLKYVINQIVLMYSAMVKNSLKSSVENAKLYRGTTIKNTELSSMGFISTTKNKDIASNYFTIGNKKNAIIEVRPKENIPFFILSKDSAYGSNMEEEVILSHFVNLNYRKIKEENNNSFMELELTKKEINIEDISINDIESIRENAVKSLNECGILSNKINKLYEDILELNNRLNSSSLSDKLYITQTIKNNYEKIDQLNILLKEQEKIYLDFKDKTNKYIKSECYKIEQIIKQNYNNELEQKKETENKKENHIKLIETNREIIKNYINKINDIKNILNSNLVLLNKFKIGNKVIDNINNLLYKLQTLDFNISKMSDEELLIIQKKIEKFNLEEYTNSLQNNSMLNIKEILFKKIQEEIINNKDNEINNKINIINKPLKGIKKIVSNINKKEKMQTIEKLNLDKQENLNRIINKNEVINYISNINIPELEKAKILEILNLNIEYVNLPNIDYLFYKKENIQNETEELEEVKAKTI